MRYGGNKITNMKGTIKMSLNNAEIALIESLRSDRYNQGYGSLRPSNGAFCCLGVACDISYKGYWKQQSNNSPSIYVPINTDDPMESMNLPISVMRQLDWTRPFGLLLFRDRENNIVSLTALNDSEMFTFDQIADIIQAELIEKEEK